MTNWGEDFIADCSGAPKGVMERNTAWWNKYSDTIQKYKNRIIQQASCWTKETECGCYAKDEEIPIKEDQCVLNLGTFPDVAGFWKLTFELKINSLPTEIDPDVIQAYPNVNWSYDFISGIGSSMKSKIIEYLFIIIF